MNNGTNNSKSNPELPLADMFSSWIKSFAQLPLRIQDIEEKVETIHTHLAAGVPADSKVDSPDDSAVRSLHQIRDRLERGETVLENLGRSLESLSQNVSELRRQEQLNYQERVILPLVRQLEAILGWVADAQHHWGEWNERIPQLNQLLRAIQSQILDLLAQYEVDPLEAPPGTPFDPHTMQAINATVAGNVAWEVDSTVRVGFRLGKRIISYQKVQVRESKVSDPSPSFCNSPINLYGDFI